MASTSESLSTRTSLQADTLPNRAKTERIVSLDAFRGLTMALMVLVNNAGSNAIFHQFQHADWNGWTVADIVFPSFLWIVGVAITLSMERRMPVVARPRLLAQAFRRSVVLFLLGIVIYIAPYFDLSTQRVLGVLQRIAICYLVATAIYLYTGLRGQLLWTIGLLAGYWLLMEFVPVPHYGAGNLTVEGNFEHYVDRIVLGRHNYRWTQTWDPEGILSTLPAIATTLLGLLGGRLLRLKHQIAECSVWFLVIGNVLMVTGLTCDIWLPINKHIWTSSFAIFMAGIDFVTFGITLWVVDGCGFRRAVKPLTVMGMNAIAVYVVSELFAELIAAVRLSHGGVNESLREWVYRGWFLRLLPDSTAALLYAIAFLLAMYAFAHLLYRKKWFLRV